MSLTNLEIDELYSLLNKEKTSILKQKTERDLLLKQKQEKLDHLKEIQLNEENTILARDLLEKSSQEARIKGQSILEEAVTKILQIVFGDIYKIRIETTVRAGTPSADVYVEKRIGLNQELIDLNNEGGGLTDIISLAFFVAVSRLVGQENAGIVVMDEPTSAVSKAHAESVAEAISILTEYLGKASLIITHEREYLPNLIEHVYYVEQGADGISRVTEL